MSITIENVSKKFGNFPALDQVNIKVETGELLALLGPSGCGKTTLLRMIAGLELPDSGSISLGDSTPLSANGSSSAGLAGKHSGRDRQNHQAPVGFVFQHYALFPHMSVFDNVAFGLTVQKKPQRPDKAEIAHRVHELLAMVQMEWAAPRLPTQLSGGQRQRIALARALAIRPQVLLLDEPFSALDAKVRLELRRWLRKLHHDLHITSIFVTHDQEEALELADRVVIMNQGKIEQQGTPESVYDSPANAFVYNFLGNVNVFHGRLNDQQKSGRVFVRPHNIELVLDLPVAGADGANFTRAEWFAVKLQNLRWRGGSVGLELLRLDDQSSLEAEISRDRLRELQLERGQRLYARFKEARFFEDTEYVI